MINQEQLISGVIRYIDAEVLSVLPTSGKWVAGTAVALAQSKSQTILNGVMRNPIVKGLELVDENGLIDSDALFMALRAAADKYGVMEFNLPLIGTLRFSGKDVDTLRRYVVGGVVYE